MIDLLYKYTYFAEDLSHTQRFGLKHPFNLRLVDYLKQENPFHSVFLKGTELSRDISFIGNKYYRQKTSRISDGNKRFKISYHSLVRYIVDDNAGLVYTYLHLLEFLEKFNTN